ncbi:MAG TPA: hypothetical protein VGE93_14620, partial [Bryobacteraceae bacterium]
ARSFPNGRHVPKEWYFLLMVWGVDDLYFFHFDPMNYASFFPLAASSIGRCRWARPGSLVVRFMHQHFRTSGRSCLSRLARFQVISAIRGGFSHAKLD